MCHLPLAEWIQQYRESFIPTDKLQQIVDSFMQDYDKRKEEVRILVSSMSQPLISIHLTSTCFSS